MKKVKSFAAVIICLCLIAGSFAGCSKISLEGKWTATVDLTSFANSELDMSQDEDGEYFGEFNEPLSMELIYTFDSNNAYTVSVNEEKFKTDFNAFLEKYIDYMTEGTYKYAESQGMTRDEFDEYYKSEYGKTLRESFSEEMKADEWYNEFSNEFTTTEPQPTIIEDGRFYDTDDQGNKTGYETYTLDGDTLTINGQFDMNDKEIEDEDNIYPLTLTKTA